MVYCPNPITYDKVRDIQIKSEQEAYKEILDGNVQYYSEYKMIKTLLIHNIEVSSIWIPKAIINLSEYSRRNRYNDFHSGNLI